MTIEFMIPFSKGFNRMKKALFQPFDIGKWFTVGFTAFLAGLLDGNGGSGGSSSRRHGPSESDIEQFFEFPQHAMDWLADNPLWTSLIVFGVLFLIALIITLNWLSSRGKFMFLHNVVNDKAEISKPWRAYKSEGNSLFLWRLVYGFIVLFLIVIFFTLGFSLTKEIVLGYDPVSSYVSDIIGMIFLFLAVMIVTSYISLFLDSFIVPIMFKRRISALQAWSVFLPLMRKHFWNFVLYGLLVLLIVIVIVVAIMLFGFLTCCVGFFILVIPYINAVLLLPVSYTMRAFSVEFLEQFGEEYALFPQPDLIVEEASTDES